MFEIIEVLLNTNTNVPHILFLTINYIIISALLKTLEHLIYHTHYYIEHNLEHKLSVIW